MITNSIFRLSQQSISEITGWRNTHHNITVWSFGIKFSYSFIVWAKNKKIKEQQNKLTELIDFNKKESTIFT